MLATKAKLTEKLKPIVPRVEENKVLNPLVKKLPPVLTQDQQQRRKTQIPATEEFKRLIHGDFKQDFSKQSSRLFRIFLSSTFSDFKVERNELYRRVFPSIKQKCAQLGYEFQVVDMRWGVSDTADTGHTADIICMNEIERCIDLSAGLNFIYLIGNRYGYMYVPLQIDEDEFETIVDVAREENIPNLALIQKWFLLDKNSLPPKYVYVPVTTYFKHFEEQSIEQAEEKKQWLGEEKALLNALRDAVDKAFQKKKLTDQQAVKYFQSITEREIRRGTVESNRANVIGVSRDFSNASVETAIDAKFFDSSKNERITKSISQLKTYCAKVTPTAQFKKFVVPWKSGGLNIAGNSNHRQYIDEFCQFLSTTIMQMLEATSRKLGQKTLAPYHEDFLHHALFCREKNQFFFGREELLSSIHARIETDRRGVATPLAIIAESGCGKTSFMARLARELIQWYPTGAVLIRFLGTSGPSTTIELVLRSLCTQLQMLYGNSDDNDEDANDSALTFSSLVRIFHERLKSVNKRRLKVIQKKARPKPLFILLDAIDQLENTSKYSFHFDTWLMRYLPRDVHIFVSFIPVIERLDLKELFLQLVRDDETTLFTVPRLRPRDCEDIIRSSLQVNHRQLNAEQHTQLLTTVESNSKPLYLKLLVDIARTWTCYTNASLQMKLSLPETIDEAIEQLFTRLENRHGKEFVQYSLAYLVHGLDGISENELEDCLSINDVVLNEIYAHHDPPIPHAIHVPSLLCQSFLYSIKEYLTRKRIHDKHILTFYHRKFFESTRKRSKHLRDQCHEHLIDLYCNDQPSYKRTIVLQKRSNQMIADADRLISSQLTNVLNKRKLIALPHHCLKRGSKSDALLRSKCLFNFQFLSCQLKSLGHALFLDSIRQCLRLRPQWTDLKQLYHAVWSIDDENSLDNTDLSLVLAEQILGFIDTPQIKQFYHPVVSSDQTNADDGCLQKLLQDCRDYCNAQEHCFRSVYAGFPQETGALAWTFSYVTNVLFVNEFYALVVLDGSQADDEFHFIDASAIAMITLQTGKVEMIFLDESMDRIWKGYITKNGEKIYVFGEKTVQVFSSRTCEMLSERRLTGDSKTFCNKAFCMTGNEEILVAASESRIVALDEVDDDAIHRSGRIPVKNQQFEINDRKNVEVSLRCIGADDNYVLCLIFDECDQVLITLWALNDHSEILPMRFAFLFLEESSLELFDLSPTNNAMLYLTTATGDLRILDLLKLKANRKVQSLELDETIQPISLLPGQTLTRLVCLTGELMAVSTATPSIHIFDRRDLPKILQTVVIKDPLSSWHILNIDEHHRILITLDASLDFISIYQQEKDQYLSSNPLKITFRSHVDWIDLIQTTTMLDDDEKKKPYVLIQLNDQSIQLLDAYQLSQASLQPHGLFAKIKQYQIGARCVAGCEYELKYPLVFQPADDQSGALQLRQPEIVNVDSIGMLDNDQHYLVITGEQMVHVYSIGNLTQSLFEYNLQEKSPLHLFSFQTFPSNVIIFMFLTQFIVLKIQFDSLENRFKIQSEQSIALPKRDQEYSLHWTANKRFLIVEQSLNLEDYPDLNDLRLFTCDDQLKISAIAEPVIFMKSKMSRIGKATGFRTYVSVNSRSMLCIAHQGNILQVHLPSHVAELVARPDYHCWMRHALALYQKTTEKSSLSMAITSLAVQSTDDSLLASGGDDGSIILWSLAKESKHTVFESVHGDQITSLIFDMNNSRLFSASFDRTLAVWSSSQVLHVLRVHTPIDRMQLLSSANVLVTSGKLWGFDRLMMFYIGTCSQKSISAEKNNLNKALKTTTTTTKSIEACEMASWAL